MNFTDKKPRIALMHRYGPEVHAELFHALPEIIEQLSRYTEVHYFGMKNSSSGAQKFIQYAKIHYLPFACRRTDDFDKYFKTILWIAFAPILALHCRFLKVSVIYIDESIPVFATVIRLFSGKRVITTAADMFLEVYRTKSFLVKSLEKIITAIDSRSQRKMSLIFTRARSTANHLHAQGIAWEKLRTVYDPCDFNIYHPLSAEQRQAARNRLGYNQEDVVLVHHGILHPNKGNERIIRALADLLPSCPVLKYLLIGNGPEMANLKLLVEKLLLQDSVTFTGWLETPADVNNALNAGDIGLAMRIGLPSDHFHLTGALVHSMACGLPVLAARLDGMMEVVKEDHNGLLFDPFNMDEFKQKLTELAGDREKRILFGHAAHVDARRFFSMKNAVDGTVLPILELAGINIADIS